MVIIVLILFSSVHINPFKLSFVYHHELSGSVTHNHPCCMPQLGDVAQVFEVAEIGISVHNTNDFYFISVRPEFIPVLNNKSPPYPV